jgi:putative oxidoreductase
MEVDVEKLLGTDEKSWILMAQRIALGAVVFPHGAQKLLGWFGGYGYTGTMGYFTGTLHLPAPVAFLVILAESLGALALVLGLATRLSALGVAAVMVGAVATSHAGNGFFMNWFGNQSGEGFEYHVLALALALPLVIWGGGRHALDSALRTRLGRALVPAHSNA